MLKSIPLDKIICESNRKYTKDDGFEQLLNSIQQYGILEPPIVREIEDGQFKIVAGRRRIEAARRSTQQLGTLVDCIVRDADDPVDDEEIALTENVNRQEMHPLDEAGAFKRMSDAGNPIEEIARYYARSPSSIYKRLRLTTLIDELKNWFRDGFLNISGAAVLAELPEEDQKAFFEKHEADVQQQYEDIQNGDIDEGYWEIDNSLISQFVIKTQRFKIRPCLGDDCQACDKRTHNQNNDLFKEFENMDDVCLDGECYRAQWHTAINQAIAEKFPEYGSKTDYKILFYSNISSGIPEQLYKNATHIEFDLVEGEKTRFEIIKKKDWVITGETTRKKNACYEIGENYSMDGITLSVKRVGYEEKVKEERPAKGTDGKTVSKKDIDEYGREALEAAAANRGITAADLVEKLKTKYRNSYNFKNDIGELVYNKTITRRIELEKAGVEPQRDYLSMFLRAADEEGYSYQTFIEKNFSNERKKMYSDLVGEKNISQISAGLTSETQQLFHFLFLSIGVEREVPNLDELKDIEKKENVYWEYAGIDKDEYKALYLEAAKEVVAETLDPKPKKNGKKKDKNTAAPHTKDGIRRCRVCGCTDDDCSQCIEKTGKPCYWVEEDLCSACTDNNNDEPLVEEEDNYPFEPDPDEDTDIDMSEDEYDE